MTTAEHPFFAEHRGWVAASELSAGDRLLGHDGQWVPLDGIALSDTWSVVYNLRVAEDHTYFVGCDEWGFSVWAHNAECATADLRAVLEMEGKAVDSTLGSMLANRLRKDDFGVATQLLEKHGIGGTGAELAQKVQAYRALRETGMSHAEVGHYLQTLGDVQVFRGTATGLSGNPGMVAAGRSSVSIDPARATAFATVSDAQHGGGVVLFGSRAELGGSIGYGNRAYGRPTPLMALEREVAVPLAPIDFARTAPHQLPVAQVRAILSDMGIEVSPYLRTVGDLSSEFRGLPRMTPEQIQQFLVRAGG